MSALSKHVIHQPRPLRRLFLILTSIVIVCLLVWFYLKQTNSDIHRELRQLRQQNQSLLADNAALSHRHEKLSEQLLGQEHSLAIQNATDKQLQQRINELQNDLLELNRELSFYQNITQGHSSTELQVRELQLTAIPSEIDLYHYRLVITQGKKISKPLTANVELSLKGQQDGQPVKLELATHQLKLRHVQVLEGEIRLTAGVTPTTITVSLKQPKKKTLSKNFDWKVTASSS